MSVSLVDRAREGRKSPAALKVKASNLRTRYPLEPILIVEGGEDIGPFETWIRSEDVACALKFLPGNGKEQLLAFRNMLASDETGLSRNIFFFVDRDFDDLQGQEPGEDIFCCDRYSVENYLVGEIVIESIVRDEMKIDPASEDYELILCNYRSILEKFATLISPINFHIFLCHHLGLSFENGIPDVKTFVEISIDDVILSSSIEKILEDDFLTKNLFSIYNIDDLKNKFQSLDRFKRHRGKFLFEFMRKWLECLDEDVRAYPRSKVIRSKSNSKFSLAVTDLRSCASRSERPVGLKEFVSRIYS